MEINMIHLKRENLSLYLLEKKKIIQMLPKTLMIIIIIILS